MATNGKSGERSEKLACTIAELESLALAPERGLPRSHLPVERTSGKISTTVRGKPKWW